MSMEALKLKWSMMNFTTFTARHEDYVIDVYAKKQYSTWHIRKDGKMVDCAQYHNPTHGELAAKVQAEKYLNELLKK